MSSCNSTRTTLVFVAIALAGCNGGTALDRPPQADSGFSTEGPLDAGQDDADAGDSEEGGEPAGPQDDLCDAGNEAWVKRAIPFIQGRKPDSIREVRVLTSAIEQLDDAGEDGRRMVARALAEGDLYTERWKEWLYEELRVQRSGDRLNSFCYARTTPHAETEDLAEAMRDAPPETNVVEAGLPRPTMADVAYSSIHLDDVSPLYRADLFARMAAPLTGGNVNREELEVANRALFGGIFESVYLGRTTECLQCHITVGATTLNLSSPEANRHWSVMPDVDFEHAVYGPFTLYDETRDLEDVHAIFRHAGFVDYRWCPAATGCDPTMIDGLANSVAPFGIVNNCGHFRTDHFDDGQVGLEDAIPYMSGDFPDGNNANVFDLEARFAAGLDALAESGITTSPQGDVQFPDDPNAAMAFLFSLNFAEAIWQEGMGYKLTVANHFPRNEAQRGTLQHLAETFYTSHYSLRDVVVEVVMNDYFNQAPPDECGLTTPYHMPALFDPFTKESADPLARGNGVGDMVHRFGAAVLLDSASQAMWWPRYQRFGPQTTGAHASAFLDGGLANAVGNAGSVPQFNPDNGVNLECCGAGYCDPCTDEPNNASFLRDLGLHVSQFDAGFDGVDFNGLLHWEEEMALGSDPGLGPPDNCTGPLGEDGCAGSDYIAQLVAEASGATYRDLASALKDRLITEPEIAAAEEPIIAAVMGVASLDEPVGDGAGAGARRYAGVLLNSPQFMLAGVVSRNQNPAADPTIIVSGTSANDACAYFRTLTTLSDDWNGMSVMCTAGDIVIP